MEERRINVAQPIHAFWVQPVNYMYLCYLILPLKLRPHLPELCIGAHCWLDVVHDVNVDIVQHDTVAVRSQTNNVVHCEGEEEGGEERGGGRGGAGKGGGGGGEGRRRRRGDEQERGGGGGEGRQTNEMGKVGVVHCA